MRCPSMRLTPEATRASAIASRAASGLHRGPDAGVRAERVEGGRGRDELQGGSGPKGLLRVACVEDATGAEAADLDAPEAAGERGAGDDAVDRPAQARRLWGGEGPGGRHRHRPR